MSELKPCPFCGRIPSVDDCGDNRFFVRCKCGIAQDKLYGQRCDAVKRWNTRRKQPEQLTDKEQRIFLAAMGREEKVCKQVDDECRNCREPYEDSLVRTCHEITRKVKGALWMI